MFDDFFDYETPKQVHVNSKFVGFLNRLIQLGIVTYIGGSVYDVMVQYYVMVTDQ
jgi:hypothetical protein